ncbi:SRPBCC family protein [Arthrobacter sp. AD-310]
MTERHLTVSRRAAASPASLWAVLEDFPHLADVWNGLKGSEPIGTRAGGLGARRKVRLAPVGTMTETVTGWEPGRTLATINQPSALVPFRKAKSRLVLEPDGGGTAMTFDYRYVPRGGPLGRLTGPAIDRMLAKSFEDMLLAVETAARRAGITQRQDHPGSAAPGPR